MNVEQEILELKSKIESAEKKKHIYIPVITAIVAAIASISAAVIAYKTSSEELSSADRIATDKNVIEIFSQFGDHIVKGTKEEKCTALLLVGSIQPTFEIKDRTKALAKQIKCADVKEALSASEGKTCGERARITDATKSKLSGKDLAEATSMCAAGAVIPERYEGPWKDGTVTFYFGKTSGDREVWCNCEIGE